MSSTVQDDKVLAAIADTEHKENNENSTDNNDAANKNKTEKEIKIIGDEEMEERVEKIRGMKNMRKTLIPQVEQIISFMAIPFLGAFALKKLGFAIPVLPTVAGVSFCWRCHQGTDLSKVSFLKT
ncbi:hypothetical protein RFI_32091 [Reticulomyxa filosa]|uniref:Uncharacterized protein n=1 Tax=Reticulomyxa filosa TaxID=46433 RepID=X6LUJ8_RETFI|nr:hypothetical protein RFI_32091 [Reticulomyxa filosa]|eukprot:ETO05304.1 hypothetical protein RFI_32091 [Reticulomyxa filosa]